MTTKSRDYPPQPHHRLAAPADVIAQAIRVADGKHALGAGALGELAIRALREAGYVLMRPVCEACEDEAGEATS